MRHQPAATTVTMAILVFLVPLLGCGSFALVGAGASLAFNWHLELDRSRVITISIGPALNDRCYKPPYLCTAAEWWRRTLEITYSTAHRYRTLLTVPLPDWRPEG